MQAYSLDTVSSNLDYLEPKDTAKGHLLALSGNRTDALQTSALCHRVARTLPTLHPNYVTSRPLSLVSVRPADLLATPAHTVGCVEVVGTNNPRIRRSGSALVLRASSLEDMNRNVHATGSSHSTRAQKA